jgi:hypothetical protein
MGETGGGAVMRLEQRGAVAFRAMGAAVVVIQLITLWGVVLNGPDCATISAEMTAEQ